jgi:predicted nucleic acid-binding protein
MSAAGLTDGYGRSLALDNSAWARVLDGRITGIPRLRYDAAVRADELMVADPFRLEALYSARDGAAFEELRRHLGGFRHAQGTSRTWPRAIDLQRQLAEDRRISHRVKLADLLLAACAEEAGAGILHYDHDYDVLAGHTDLDAESVWITPRGSVD